MKIKKSGQGPCAVILVHGGPSLSNYMGTLGKLISSDCTVYEYDQRGTFENPSPLNEISLDQHLQDLKFIVEQTGSSQTIVVGHSWGANLGLLYGAKYPNTIQKLILIGNAPMEGKTAEAFSTNLLSNLTEEETQKLRQIDETFEKLTSMEEKIKIMQKRLDLLGPHYHHDPKTNELLPELKWNFETFQVCIGQLWEVLESDKLPEILSSLTLPVVAFHGEEDPIPFKSTHDFLKKHLKNLTFITIPKAGHFPWLEDKDGVFLKKFKSSLRLPS